MTWKQLSPDWIRAVVGPFAFDIRKAGDQWVWEFGLDPMSQESLEPLGHGQSSGQKAAQDEVLLAAKKWSWASFTACAELLKKRSG